MTKEEVLNVLNEIIDESAKSMKEKAKKILDTKEFDVNVFGDRNSFARVMYELLIQYEIPQYSYKGNRKEKTFKNVYYGLMDAYIQH